MKYSRFYIITLFFFLCSCDKDCEAVSAETCSDVVPNDTGIVCQWYHERWFYNNETKSCTMQTWSGCYEKGFETEKECENCDCQ